VLQGHLVIPPTENDKLPAFGPAVCAFQGMADEPKTRRHLQRTSGKCLAKNSLGCAGNSLTRSVRASCAQAPQPKEGSLHKSLGEGEQSRPHRVRLLGHDREPLYNVLDVRSPNALYSLR
jgi:hypothetical protein